MSTRYDRVEVTSRAQWRAWLAEHHATCPGIWAVTYKRPDKRHVPARDLNAEALCFGWIDSQPRALDTARSQLLITPRKPSSKWSKINKDRVEQLTASGLMHPAGLAVVDAAKAAGTWTALDAVEALDEPPDLALALDAHGSARAHWDAFPRSARRAILEWIAAARKPETRHARITQTAEMAAENLRANQWRRPKGR